ncbi:MAG: CoA transferase [Chloroflexi bacterium]|nr:CoA transferase [Chloroflexota bacterium]
MSDGALHGIRVIDWTLRHQGPAGGMYLAALGADVIHVEQKGVGDIMRGTHTIFGASMTLPGDRNIFFEDLNRNKRGISIDLSKPQGKEIMHGLVEKSDVFITNYRPKAALKLGMDYETLRKLNPRLIYGLATAYGDRGPEKDSGGIEPAVFARSGALSANGYDDAPTLPPIASGDRTGGLFLAFGVVTALLVRERTGKGQRFSTSQLGAMTSILGHLISTAYFTGRDIRYEPRARAAPLGNFYRCRDGRWLALSIAIDPDRSWPELCQAIDRSELADDPRFNNMEARSENREELIAIFDRHFATRDCEEWEKKLREGGDFIFSRVNTLVDAVTDPQVLANDYIVDFDHPVLGKMKQVAMPFDFSETPVRIHSPAPDIGQHNVEVLQEILGYPMDKIVSLMEQDVI